MDLHGRVALITGASGGLGAVTARILADERVHVAVTHLGHHDEALEVCRQIEAKGRKSFVVHLDQTDPASCSAAVEATVNTLGRLDILINNAAWNDPVPLPDLDSLTPEIWDRAVNTNLRGPFLMTRAAAPHRKNRRFLTTWLSHDDLVQLVKKSICSGNVKFGIYYGVSNNKGRFWDISNAEQELEFHLQDDASSLPMLSRQ